MTSSKVQWLNKLSLEPILEHSLLKYAIKIFFLVSNYEMVVGKIEKLGILGKPIKIADSEFFKKGQI